MASVSIDRTWADGSNVTVRVKCATSFPNALAEARAEALSAFKGAIDELLDVQGGDE